MQSSSTTRRRRRPRAVIWRFFRRLAGGLRARCLACRADDAGWSAARARPTRRRRHSSHCGSTRDPEVEIAT